MKKTAHSGISQEYIKEKITFLKSINKAVIKSGGRIFEKPYVPLTSLIPIIASSISPSSLIAQCGIGTTSPGVGDVTLIDIDDDGTNDFALDPNGSGAKGDLFLGVLNGSEILARSAPVAGYFYATRFTSGQMISSVNANWRGAGQLPDGGGISNQATLDYQSNGDWDPSQTGYVAVRIDGNKLGFIEISWNGGTGTALVNLAKSGVQDAANASKNTLAIGACNTLPVEFLFFKANAERNSILLNWGTSIEVNNQGFEIQRSLDNINFRTVHWEEGQGNSTEEIIYNYRDLSVRDGYTYYYRLKQIDYNGRHSFSNTISATNEASNGFFGSIQNENPSRVGKADLTVFSEEVSKGTINVFNSAGLNVYSENIQFDRGENSLEADLSGLPSGNYYIQVSNLKHKFYLTYSKVN